MRKSDDPESRAQGWRTLAALHACIEDVLERDLQREPQLSVSEYGVLDVLSRQGVSGGRRLRMTQLAQAVVPSQSATTRLVNRLERRRLVRPELSDDDRRGIHLRVTEAGAEALARARWTYDESLGQALREAAELPELAPLVAALAALGRAGFRRSGSRRGLPVPGIMATSTLPARAIVAHRAWWCLGDGGGLVDSADDGGVETRAQGWRTLAALHARIEDVLERALQQEHELSVSEYALLDVLSRQEPRMLLRMNQVAKVVVLSQSATTRLVTRLERRGLLQRSLCETDRRGIYTEVTAAGRSALERARSTHDETLAQALKDAAELPELAPLVDALAALPQSGATPAR